MDIGARKAALGCGVLVLLGDYVEVFLLDQVLKLVVILALVLHAASK